MSLTDRIGNAFKAGAKGAADSILGPGDNAAAPVASVAGQSITSGIKLPTWALPAAGAALVLFLVTKK